MTGREYLDWCVQRAMEYADRGDMAGAWASFGSDTMRHEATKHITGHELFGMAMFSGLYNTPRDFKDFISGWAVGA